jgi:hypothetical protein
MTIGPRVGSKAAAIGFGKQFGLRMKGYVDVDSLGSRWISDKSEV